MNNSVVEQFTTVTPYNTNTTTTPNSLPSSADFESFRTYISQLDGTTLTYDGIRSIARQAYKCYVPKIIQPNNRFFVLVTTPEVVSYLQSLTRKSVNGFYEHVFISVEDYKTHSEFDNEVGAIHEFRIALANETCSPNKVKFLTNLSQRHQINCNDPLTFSVALKDDQFDQIPSP